MADLQCVVLDCPEPVQLAEFYQSLIGGTVNQQDQRWALDEWTSRPPRPASGGSARLCRR
ncbi:VOC family protein [Streptomyces sp. NPDC019443]|uniref:VOC family protein n=1 Tax=Streptomyces sp. NPDC019443 TaxID=3365061 RepID=UPI0037AE31E4